MGNTDFVNDYSSLEHLRRQGLTGGKAERSAALRQAANQFEAMFTQMWLKVQRESTKELYKDNPLSSSTSELYQSMLDEQMSAQLASNGVSMQSGGLSELIVRQLDKSSNSSPSTGELHMPNESRSFALNRTPGAFSLENARRQESAAQVPLRSEYFGREFALDSVRSSRTPDVIQEAELQKHFSVKGRDGKAGKAQQDFVDKLMPIARKVASKFGLDPMVMVAQAALETGWGRHLMKKGAASANNFYGIKAGGRKTGTTRANSYEYVNGKKVMVNSSFRAYSSIEASMEDYARLITGNSRYSRVKDAQTADNYFEELQKAGYATDPKYADKLKKIIRNPAFREYWS